MKTISREEFEKQNVFGTGAENTGSVSYTHLDVYKRQV